MVILPTRTISVRNGSSTLVSGGCSSTDPMPSNHEKSLVKERQKGKAAKSVVKSVQSAFDANGGMVARLLHPF